MTEREASPPAAVLRWPLFRVEVAANEHMCMHHELSYAVELPASCCSRA